MTTETLPGTLVFVLAETYTFLYRHITETTARKGPAMDLSPTTLITVSFFLLGLLIMFAWAYFDSHGPDHI